jgi:DEAD/DEAH box helicase domain-containing protein
VLNGFPGTIASMWQQAGRAGRARQRSLAVLVAGDDQLDQWFMAHPTEMFTRPPEPAVINPSNPFVFDAHLTCAAGELPLTHDDEHWFGPELEDAVHRLVLDDQLVVRRGRALWAGRGSPAAKVGLRTGMSDEYRIVDEHARLIGTVDASRAFESVHPGALYLHQGQQYRVESLDIADRAAWVAPTSVDESTHPRRDVSVTVLGEDERVAVGGACLHLGPVEIADHVIAYQRKALRTGEVIDTVALDLPPTRLVTRAFWYTVPQATVAASGIELDRLPGALHAAEHAGIGMLPLFTICDRWDVGGVSTVWQEETGEPTIVIYDGYPGGAGIAELGYAAGRRHLEATLDVISACPCATGCPSCIQSPKCGNWNEPLDKAGAIALLHAILDPAG